MKCPYCDTEFDVDALRNYDEDLHAQTEENMTWESAAGAQWQEGETEGLVNVPLTIKNVRISLLLKEAEEGGHFRVSLRSKKGTSAQQCAMNFFNGGGHENAAGGKLFPGKDLGGESLEEYVKKALLSVLQ
jgi:nanoRNase/pAp phosphatase (c-di-AMP/oligoRNAs hydrolase)